MYHPHRKKEIKQILTCEAIRAHLFPILAWSSMINLSSSWVNAPFLKFGLKWFAHRSLQLFPQRESPECFWTAFQLPSPCFLTYSTRSASSEDVHGPFFKRTPPPELPPLLSSINGDSLWYLESTPSSLSFVVQLISKSAINYQSLPRANNQPNGRFPTWT